MTARFPWLELRGLGSQAQRAWQFYYGVLQAVVTLLLSPLNFFSALRSS